MKRPAAYELRQVFYIYYTVLNIKASDVSAAFDFGYIISDMKAESIRIGYIHMRQSNSNINTVHAAQHFRRNKTMMITVYIKSRSIMDKIPWLTVNA